MKSIPTWRREVRAAVKTYLESRGYGIIEQPNDMFVVRPKDCDADVIMRGIGQLAAVAVGELFVQQVENANRNP